MKFEELHIDKWLIQSLNEVAITQPTVIQEACIPQILAGNECTTRAKERPGVGTVEPRHHL